MKTEEIIRKGYAAFLARDRKTFETLLSDNFAFTSPQDDHIDKAAYFKRCWPGGDRFADFEIEKLFVEGNEAFIRYRITLKDGSKFRNTELIRTEDDKLREVEVFFGSESNSASEESEIRVLIDARVAGVRQKNAADLVALYVKDAVQFGLAPPLQAFGIKQDYVQGWLDSFEGAIDYEVTDVRIVAEDEVAFTTSLNRIAGTKTDGQPTEVWVRETLGLRKTDGAWKIAHEHTSMPFYMDSMKAAVDLEP